MFYDFIYLAKGFWMRPKVPSTLMDFSIFTSLTSQFAILNLNRKWQHLRGVWCTSLIIFILFQIEIPVCKQCRPWSDTTFCSIWSGSALFAYVPKMGLGMQHGIIKAWHFIAQNLIHPITPCFAEIPETWIILNVHKYSSSVPGENSSTDLN